MRSALARRPPAARHLVVVSAARATAARRTGPRAVRLGGAALAFLVAYGALTVAHELRHEPAFVGAISAVPLFARVILSAAIAPPAGLVAGRLGGHRPRVLRMMPSALAAAIGLTVLAILVFA